MRAERQGETVLAVDELVVGPGLTAVLGDNGAGKTTLLRIAAGLDRPVAGVVETLGAPAGSRALRGRVAFVGDRDRLPDGPSGFELVRHGARLAGASRRAAPERASAVLHDLGVGEERHRPARDLSLGQRRRVRLALAIASSPSLLLVDEPAEGLDGRAHDELLDIITATAASGRHVVMTTHRRDDAAAADRVVCLEGGRVVGPLAPGASVQMLVSGDVDGLVRALRRRRLSVARTGDIVRVEGDDPATRERTHRALRTVDVSLRWMR